MALRLVVEIPAACVFPGLAILLTLRIQEHHLAMCIDALSFSGSRVQTYERRGLVVHLLKERIDGRIITTNIRIVLRVGHVLEDGEVLDGLKKHRDQFLLQFILELDDFFFLNVILVLEHLAQFKPLGELFLVIFEILVKTFIGNEGKERIPTEGGHLQGLILLFAPYLQVTYIRAHPVILGMKITAQFVQ